MSNPQGLAHEGLVMSPADPSSLMRCHSASGSSMPRFSIARRRLWIPVSTSVCCSLTSRLRSWGSSGPQRMRCFTGRYATPVRWVSSRSAISLRALYTAVRMRRLRRTLCSRGLSSISRATPDRLRGLSPKLILGASEMSCSDRYIRSMKSTWSLMPPPWSRSRR